MDTKTFKATNSEGGTLTAQLLPAEVTTLHLTPVPDKAPGTITINAGTATEEEIFYKTKDAVAGTVSGLIRDYSNLNGGTGRQHENGNPWETLQSVTPLNNLVDAIQDGYIEEIQAVLYVSASSFTVATDRTGYYTAGRMLRINQNGSLIGYVASSSYSAGTGLTTVNTTGVTVPDPITHMEMGIQPKNAPAYSTATKTETLTNKTLTSPTLAQVATPDAPAAGLTTIYSKTDGKLYIRPTGGAETEVGAALTMCETFIIPGTLATGTDLAKTWVLPYNVKIISATPYVKTAGTTNATTFDVNLNGSTIATTKLSIATGDTAGSNQALDDPTTTRSAGGLVTIDCDSVSTTAPIEGYILVFYTRA